MNEYSGKARRIVHDQFKRITGYSYDDVRWEFPNSRDDVNAPFTWIRAFKLLLAHELGETQNYELNASVIARNLYRTPELARQAAANITEVRKKLAHYYKETANSADRIEISLADRGYQISFQRRGIIKRFLPSRIAKRSTFFGVPIRVSPSIFLTASISPAAWIVLCRIAGWTYYLGGSGNEPAGWHSLAWGTVSALPIIVYVSLALWRIPRVLITFQEKARIISLLLIQTLAAGSGAYIFYSLSLRNVIESWHMPVFLQEFLIAGLWAFLFAAPILLATTILYLWKISEICRQGFQVILCVMLFVGFFQIVVPSSRSSVLCKSPHLILDGTRGLLIQGDSSCLPFPATFMFDQARGLLAGVALPFFTLYSLMRFVQGVADGHVTERKTMQTEKVRSASAGAS